MMGPESYERLPMAVRQMLFVLSKNGMWPANESTFTKGRSIDDPIVIELKGNYVRMEYLIAEFLLHRKTKKLTDQFFYENDNCCIDKLVYDVTGEDGSVHKVSFYFDITIGFKAISG